jgi:hypothetical protein
MWLRDSETTETTRRSNSDTAIVVPRGFMYCMSPVGAGIDTTDFAIDHEVMKTMGAGGAIDAQIAFVIDFIIAKEYEKSAWVTAIGEANRLKVVAQGEGGAGAMDLNDVNSEPDAYAWLADKTAQWFETTTVRKFGWYRVMLGIYHKQQVRVGF